MILLKELINERYKVYIVELDITKKINKVLIVSKEFKPQGEDKPIAYKRLVLQFTFNGNVREKEFKLSNDLALVLESIGDNGGLFDEDSQQHNINVNRG